MSLRSARPSATPLVLRYTRIGVRYNMCTYSAEIDAVSF